MDECRSTGLDFGSPNSLQSLFYNVLQQENHPCGRAWQDGDLRDKMKSTSRRKQKKRKREAEAAARL